MVTYDIQAAWELIKANKTSLPMIKALKNRAILLAAEAIQVAAMCTKFIDSNLK